ncbi:unnamed protein product, partial [Polarella glacialis]
LRCSAFKAAFVELEAKSPCGAEACGRKQKEQSLQAYAASAADAKRQGAQIVLYPEYGITGESTGPTESWVSGGYTETWAESAVGSTPCDSPSSYEQ